MNPTKTRGWTQMYIYAFCDNDNKTVGKIYLYQQEVAHV
jgi:hypothetical protein